MSLWFKAIVLLLFLGSSLISGSVCQCNMIIAKGLTNAHVFGGGLKSVNDTKNRQIMQENSLVLLSDMYLQIIFSTDFSNRYYKI